MIQEALPCDRLAIHVPQSEREEQMQNTPAPRGALPAGDTAGSTSEQLFLVTKLARPSVGASCCVPRWQRASWGRSILHLFFSLALRDMDSKTVTGQCLLYH